MDGAAGGRQGWGRLERPLTSLSFIGYYYVR